MKKFTFMLLTAFFAVAALAAGPQKRPFTEAKLPVKEQIKMGQMFNAKQMPKEMIGKIQGTRARVARRAAAAADLVGDYTWDYLQSSESSTDLESLSTTAGSTHVVIAESATTEGGITISGMFTNDLEATVVSDESGDYITIAGGQLAGTSNYGDYVLYGMFYYEGDDTYEAGWYYSDITGVIGEDGVITFAEWFVRVLSGGDYNGYSLTPYWVEGSTLTPADPLTPVTLPEGAEVVDYGMIYDGGSTPVKVAVVNDEVYIQGMSYYIPEAWVKGTKDGNTVTFAAMQYMGEYGSYGSSYFFYNGETVFTYDPEAGTYSAEGQVFGVLADRYYDGNYTNPVIKPVVDKAAMPSNPEITSVANGSYGWYMTFNVPLTYVDGDFLVASKLTYMFYIDIEGEIAPLTFTPATHSRLTEDMTEIPYGFTEGYDFYDNQIYFNDLFSEDWNNIGIQSTYNGGGEVNVTDIQWFHLKDYKIQYYTFNFNEWDVPTSSNVTTDGDITEDTDYTEGNVTLTVSPKTTSTAENRFWATSNGPQLRVYSGTLTFTVPADYAITQIVFNNGKWNDGNTADSGQFNGATWTPAEGDDPVQEVVVSIAGNSQINSIEVTTERLEVKPVEAPEDLETETYLFTALSRTSVYDEEAGAYYLGDPVDYKSQLEVGFYGENGEKVYIKGFSTDFPDFWVMAKKNKDGQYVIPANQWMGTYDYMGYFTFDYYFTAVSEDGSFQDVVLNFDEETSTFTTDQILALNGSAEEFDPYLTFENVVIEKMQDVAATPADPDIINFVPVATYPKIDLYVPAVDAEGNDILTSNLYYTIWVEKDGKEQPLTLAADLYKYLEEDMTEIPYTFDDSYDIYAGGDRVYLNQDPEEIASWTKVGVQSIYYGGGEVNKSNITWYAIAKVGEAQYATFVPTTDVDFTDNAVEAYAATFDGQYVQLAPVTAVPAGTAVVVKAEAAGSFLVAATTDAVLGASNELVAATADVTADGTQYVLAQVDGTVGFYKTNEGSTIAAGKGYLVISQPMAAFYPFGSGEATGISGIGASTENAVIYNLAGQRVSKMQKGINIVNGKKVLY